ncbi:MAG: hypothetical protein R3C42_07345 [Parvularculaceae bacterium]|nr:hypothetical protein [Parvularculaceae bacterium]
MPHATGLPNFVGGECPDHSEQVGLPIPNTGKKYGWSRTRTYELLKSGKIKGKKIGRRTIVDDASAREYWKNLPDYKAGA